MSPETTWPRWSRRTGFTKTGPWPGALLTGTGFATINAGAALASAYFAFAKAGFDPTITTGTQSINYGDVNDDGNVTSIDASQVARHAVGLITLTPDAILRGDVNGSAT